MFLYRRLNQKKKKKKLYFKISSTKLVSHPCKVSSCLSALSRHSSAAHDSGRNKHDSKIKWKIFLLFAKENLYRSNSMRCQNSHGIEKIPMSLRAFSKYM